MNFSSLCFHTVLTAIQGIIDATTEQLNDIEKECAEKNNVRFLSKIYVLCVLWHFSLILLRASQEHPEGSDAKAKTDAKKEDIAAKSEITSDELMKLDDDELVEEKTKPLLTEHDLQIEKRLELLKEALHVKSVENDDKSDLKSIYLDGELPHDPSILVSATETEAKTERISKYTDEIADDEAVVLSGKMTISFLSLPTHQDQHDKENQDMNKDASTKA